MNRKNIKIFFSFFLLLLIIINGLNTETYFTTKYILSIGTTNIEDLNNVLVYFPIIMINNNTLHDIYNQPDWINPEDTQTVLKVTPTEYGNYLLSSKPSAFRDRNNYYLSYDLGTVTEGTDTIYFESYNYSSNQIYFKVLSQNDTGWTVEATLEVYGYDRLKFYGLTLIEKVSIGHPFGRIYKMAIPPEKIGQWVGLTVPQEISLTTRSNVFFEG